MSISEDSAAVRSISNVTSVVEQALTRHRSRVTGEGHERIRTSAGREAYRQLVQGDSHIPTGTPAPQPGVPSHMQGELVGDLGHEVDLSDRGCRVEGLRATPQQEPVEAAQAKGTSPRPSPGRKRRCLDSRRRSPDDRELPRSHRCARPRAAGLWAGRRARASAPALARAVRATTRRECSTWTRPAAVRVSGMIGQCLHYNRVSPSSALPSFPSEGRLSIQGSECMCPSETNC
jgi:hypothetical protein